MGRQALSVLSYLLTSGLLLSLSACSGSGSGEDGGDNEITPPSFHHFNAPERHRVDMSFLIRFLVGITDPSDQVVSGRLLGEEDSVVYGDLSWIGHAVDENYVEYDTYTLNLSIDEIASVKALEGNGVAELSRTFRGIFMLRDGTTLEQSKTVAFYCSENSDDYLFCNDECTYVKTNEDHCGECNHPCNHPTPFCRDSACIGETGLSGCFAIGDFTDCDDYCQSINLTCSHECEVMSTGGSYEVTAWAHRDNNCTQIIESYATPADCSRTNWPAEAVRIDCCCMR